MSNILTIYKAENDADRKQLTDDRISYEQATAEYLRLSQRLAFKPTKTTRETLLAMCDQLVERSGRVETAIELARRFSPAQQQALHTLSGMSNGPELFAKLRESTSNPNVRAVQIAGVTFDFLELV